MNLTAWERYKAITLQEIENALTEKIGDDTNVVAEVEGVAKVNTLIAVGFVVERESRQYSQLYTRRIPIFLYRTNDFDGTSSLFPFVIGFDDFAKGTLTQQFDDVICEMLVQ